MENEESSQICGDILMPNVASELKSLNPLAAEDKL